MPPIRDLRNRIGGNRNVTSNQPQPQVDSKKELTNEKAFGFRPTEGQNHIGLALSTRAMAEDDLSRNLEANLRATHMAIEGPGFPSMVMTILTPRHLPPILARAAELGHLDNIRSRLVLPLQVAAGAVTQCVLQVHQIMREELQCDVLIENTVISDLEADATMPDSEEHVRSVTRT